MSKLNYMAVLVILVIATACSTNTEPDDKAQDEATTTKVIESEEKAIKDNVESEPEDKPLQEKPDTETSTETTNNEPLLSDQDQQIQQWMASMTVEEKVGQLFFVGVQTYENGQIPAGGIIYFKPDIVDAALTKAQIDTYQVGQKVPLFMGIDEEGGLVTRITGKDSIGGTVIPSSWNLYHDGDDTSIGEATAIITSEIATLGFNMNFAPVADIHSNPGNPIIGHRAYSDTAEQVIDGLRQALDVYDQSSIVPVVKHFPGHGDTEGDSHLEPVYINKSIDELMAQELQPFVYAINRGISSIMIGHISLPEVTGTNQPASLSEIVLKDLLIKELGYQGMIISDSLLMKSITSKYSYQEVIDVGLTSGLTMFLLPEEPELAYAYLVEQVKESDLVLELVEEALYKNLKVKYELTQKSSQTRQK